LQRNQWHSLQRNDWSSLLRNRWTTLQRNQWSDASGIRIKYGEQEKLLLMVFAPWRLE
jgi:hypothetical protein